jgi:hypothetical protein
VSENIAEITMRFQTACIFSMERRNMSTSMSLSPNSCKNVTVQMNDEMKNGTQEERVIKLFSITRDEVMRVLHKMEKGKVIKKGYLKFVLRESRELLHSLDNVYNVSHPLKQDKSPSNSTLTVRMCLIVSLSIVEFFLY